MVKCVKLCRKLDGNIYYFGVEDCFFGYAADEDGFRQRAGRARLHPPRGQRLPGRGQGPLLPASPPPPDPAPGAHGRALLLPLGQHGRLQEEGTLHRRGT